MSAKEVIKNSVLKGISNESITNSEILLVLFLSCLLGIYIFAIYKAFSKAAFYSLDLNITMAGMVIVTSAIMLAMQSNLIVSLGMVGALSIVRFRTAIKNPLDLLYMYWSISAGIINGVGLFSLAVELSIVMTVLVSILRFIPTIKSPKLLVIKGTQNIDVSKIAEIIKNNSSYQRNRLVSVNGNRCEVIYEIKCSEIFNLIKRLKEIDGIEAVNYVEHDGEIRG